LNVKAAQNLYLKKAVLLNWKILLMLIKAVQNLYLKENKF